MRYRTHWIVWTAMVLVPAACVAWLAILFARDLGRWVLRDPIGGSTVTLAVIAAIYGVPVLLVVLSGSFRPEAELTGEVAHLLARKNAGGFSTRRPRWRAGRARPGRVTPASERYPRPDVDD